MFLILHNDKLYCNYIQCTSAVSAVTADAQMSSRFSSPE